MAHGPAKATSGLPASTPRHASSLIPPAVRRIGCVSFLNAKPLIDGLEGQTNPSVKFDVPSGLLADLETGAVDIALCPVIDYQRSAAPLEVVPVGGIGCDGTTLTVRLYSQVPLKEITHIHADSDSHTSVALLRVLLAESYGLTPRIIDYQAREHIAEHRLVDWPEAVLLIGDKVVTDSPPAVRYPHQLDLGHAWRELTGLPFVFAVWMCRAGADLGDLPATLQRTRLANAGRIGDIVDRHAEAHGWPKDLAMQYLGRWLRYDIGAAQIQAIERFSAAVHRQGMVPNQRPLRLYR